MSPREHFEWQLSLSDEEKAQRAEYFEALMAKHAELEATGELIYHEHS